MGILNKEKVAFSLASPPEDMLRAMAAVTADLDQRAAVAQAITRNLADEAQAQGDVKTAAVTLAEVELDLALQTDSSKKKAMEQALQASRAVHSEASQKAERFARLRVVLAEKAKEVDTRLKSNRALFDIETATYNQQVFSALGAELREAAKPVIAVLMKAHAATYGLGAGFSMVGLLEEVALPSAVYGEQPIIRGSKVTNDDGRQIDLAHAWRDAPEAADVASTMKPLLDLRRRLADHQNYKDPSPPPRVHDQHTHNSKSDIERAARREAENNRVREQFEASRPKREPQRSVLLPVGSM